MVDYSSYNPSLESFGRKGGAVTASDTTDLNPLPKAIEATSAGTLLVLPVGNADEAWVDCGTVAVGYRPPVLVRRVKESSTASVIWVAD